jgi:hypothetical protein
MRFDKMKSSTAVFSVILAALSCMTARAQGTYTAASCNQSDITAVINGPIHTAVNGDTIIVPAGSCTWTSGIMVPSGIGISIIGTGTPNSGPSTWAAASSCTATVITDDLPGSTYLFSFSPTYGNSTTRISCMNLVPTVPGPSGYYSPIYINGTCTSSGCPNFRMDNLTVPETWGGDGISDDTVAIVQNVFGVADHNTVGGSPQSGTSGPDFLNVNLGSYQGTSQYGNTSWASANTLGTGQAFYLENNTFTNSLGTDTDTYGGPDGGGRLVCRFNVFNGVTQGAACTNHGTEVMGITRGGMQSEFYGNSLTAQSSGSNEGFGVRSGVAYSFLNQFNANSGKGFNYALGFNTERTIRPTGWGFCGAGSPYDVNDGYTSVYSGTVSSISGLTLTVAGTPWTSGAFNFSASSPRSTYYIAYDTTYGEIGGIASNTGNTLTFSWLLSNVTGIFGGSGHSFDAGSSFIIYGVTLYAAGTMTGSSGSTALTDSSKSWSPSQWVRPGHAYSVLDVTQGYAWQIGTSTSDTLAPYIAPSNPAWTWNNGDQYAIMSASRCLDQTSVAESQLYSENAEYTPTPAQATTQSIYPSYEWDDTFGSGAGPNTAIISDYNLTEQANTNYFYTNTSFNGTIGTGSGPLASVPASCTQGVGYFATDQGNWNQSGSSNPISYSGQGELFICGASGWPSTPSYVPYTYPHPLVSGAAGPVTVAQPTGLVATVQ